jgi:hypothetical protein
MVERVFDKSNFETAEIAGRLDMPIRVIASQAFLEHRLQRMAHDPGVFWTAPDLKLQNAFTRPSLPVLSDLMPSRGAELFDQRFSEAGNSYRFMRFWKHSWISFLHAAVTNPFCLDEIMILYRLNHGGLLNRVLSTIFSFKRSTINVGKTNVSFVGYSVIIYKPKLSG